MIHTMGLYAAPFEQIRSGGKRREYRLYDEKRRRVQVGDSILFIKLPDKQETVIVTVEGIHIFPRWADAYTAYWQEDFRHRYDRVEDAVRETYAHWWPPEQEARYGCVVFDIRPNGTP